MLRPWGVYLCLTHESASSACVGCGSSQSAERCRRSGWSCRISPVQSLISEERAPRDPRPPRGSPTRVPPQIPPRTSRKRGRLPRVPGLTGQSPCGRSGNAKGIRSCRRPAGKWNPWGYSRPGNRRPRVRGLPGAAGSGHHGWRCWTGHSWCGRVWRGAAGRSTPGADRGMSGDLVERGLLRWLWLQSRLCCCW